MNRKLLRAPPSYSTYASDDLANVRYFGLSVAERGLLDAMARAYWVAGSLPKDPRLIALVVRLPEPDVRQWLTAAVLEHFQAAESDANSLHHIELCRQLQNIALVRARQSEGGTIGAQLTNAGRGKHKRGKASRSSASLPATLPASTPAPIPSSLGRVPERTERTERTEPQSLGKPNSPKPIDPFVADMEQSERAERYRKASRGS